jgi:TRAP-type C4-dicarboxylate transport system substrate-binding protein
LHKNLTAMWEAVRAETNGRVETTVYAENNKLAGGDPAALKMLIAGEIQFFTLMGGIIGTVVPVAEAQQLPFAFKSASEAHKAIDGPFGKYIGEEMAAKGMYLFPVGGFDNGMRQVASIPRAVARPNDFAGKYVRLQREQQGAFNASLRNDFAKRGLVFNEVDQAAFRARLPKVYAAWKERLGARCWSLLEAEVGKLG